VIDATVAVAVVTALLKRCFGPGCQRSGLENRQSIKGHGNAEKQQKMRQQEKEPKATFAQGEKEGSGLMRVEKGGCSEEPVIAFSYPWGVGGYNDQKGDEADIACFSVKDVDDLHPKRRG